MKFKLFLAASAAACLALPAAGYADPPNDQGHGDSQDHGKGDKPDKPGKPAQTGHAATPAVTAAPTGASGHAGQGPAGGAQGGQDHHRSVGQTQTQTHTQTTTTTTTAPPMTTRRGGQVRGGGPAFTGTQAGATAQVQQTRRRTAGRQGGSAVSSGPAPAALSGWSHTAVGPQRVQAGQQWRQSHQGWDHSAPWRTNSNWWRGDSAFRLFLGPRVGFFFIPGRGYISVPQQYQVHYWRAGDYLPNFFWTYQVANYYRYSLPQPPDGCEWVWVDNDVALIDLSDGYILDIVHNAW